MLLVGRIIGVSLEVAAYRHYLYLAPIRGYREQPAMTTLTRQDLQYDYVWTTSPGDNPKLIHEDGHHLSRKEGYEMIRFLNNLGMASDGTEFVYGSGNDLTKEARLRVEKMLKVDLKSTSPGRGTVLKWINEKWNTIATDFQPLKAKK